MSQIQDDHDTQELRTTVAVREATIVSLTNEIKVVEEAARERIGQLQAALRKQEARLQDTEYRLDRAYRVIVDLAGPTLEDF